MQHDDRRARTAGVLFLLTFVSAIVGAALYGPLLTDPSYATGAGDDARITWGALCELVLIGANIGTAVVLFPLLRRHSEVAALGYVAARIVECVFIAVGILSVLTVVTLRRSAGDLGDPAAVTVVARALVGLHDWTFLLGPGFVVGIGNGLLLGFLMHRSRLMPRGFALLGLIGGPLMSLSGLAVLFGAYGQSSPWSAVATLPEIVWEASLGVLLTVVGVRRRARAGTAQEAEPVAS